MKVLFDHRIFTTQVYGGVSRYHYELLKLLPNEGVDVILSLLFTNNAYISNDKQFKRNFFFQKSDFWGKYYLMRKINEINTIKNINFKKFDIFHPTYFSEYILRSSILSNKPMVITVHDLIHEKYLAKDPIIPIKRKIIDQAEKIIAISENTKIDLVNVLNINPDKITVIYHGNNICPSLSSAPRIDISHPYLLYVGTRNKYKNFELFAKSFAIICRKNNDVNLICTGSPFSKTEEILFCNLGIRNRVDSYVASDSELAYLYQHALAFVFPSIYEGFGMPILEAFSCKCPVALSNSSSFPEIAQNAGAYFDPFSIDSIVYVLQLIIDDEEYRKQLVNCGQERLKKFSWRKSVIELSQLYKSIV